MQATTQPGDEAHGRGPSDTESDGVWTQVLVSRYICTWSAWHTCIVFAGMFVCVCVSVYWGNSIVHLQVYL